MTTHNGHLSYGKLWKECFTPCLCVFYPIWVLGAGERVSPKGLVHNVRMQLFTPRTSKIEVSKTCFFDIVTTHNAHPSYVKHVLRHVYVFFTLFGYWVRGGGGCLRRDWYTNC